MAKGEGMAEELLKLVPIIERVAPVLATKLLGPQAGAAISILSEVLNTEPESSQVAQALQTAPTSVAGDKLIEAEKLAGGDGAAPSTSGTLVDGKALQVKTLVTSVLFAVSFKFLGDAGTAHTVADAIAPAIVGGASILGGLALNWITSRVIRSSNEATIKALS